MKAIYEVLDLIGELFGEIYRFIFEELLKTKDHSLSAKFISEKEILSREHKGFCLTGTKNLSVKDSYNNCMISGGTGTGKSSTVLLPSILSMDSSLVILDPSGELFSKSAEALKQKGFEVKVLNFSDASRSIGFNPLERANTTSEINSVADSLIRATLGTNANDPFWQLQGKEVLGMLISILKTQGSEFQNLYNIRQLLFQLKSQPQKVDKLFARFADPVLMNQYRAFVSYDPKLSTSILATVQSSLQLLTDEEIAKVTSYDSLNMKSFRKKKIALFVQTSVNQMYYLSPLTSIFFEQFFQYVMKELPKEKDEDIFFLIDEAATLKLPGSMLAATISNIRKYRAGMLLVLQQAATQLTENYGRDNMQTILANCMTKLYFGGQNLSTTKELQDILGKYEYVDEKEIRRSRYLMTADEIRTLQNDEAILLNSFRKPMKVKLKPYYKNRRIRPLTELPSKVLQQQAEITLLLLDLDKLKDHAKA